MNIKDCFISFHEDSSNTYENNCFFVFAGATTKRLAVEARDLESSSKSRSEKNTAQGKLSEPGLISFLLLDGAVLCTAQSKPNKLLLRSVKL